MGGDFDMEVCNQFRFVLIKPSHYDDDGYVIQWYKSVLPSNTLAMLYGLTLDCQERQVLGPDMEVVIDAYDETNKRIPIKKIINAINNSSGGGMVGFVGVQTNQFPRTMDMARKFRAADIPVVIGGFHISGCLSMLPELPTDIQEAQEIGISLFAGEAENGRLDQVIQDAKAGTLKPLYNFMNDLPNLSENVLPFLPAEMVSRNFNNTSSFDAGRGCPFQCSFCTIINVQGRTSRRRTPDDVEQIIRDNAAQGIYSFFITDDNFARNKDWEAILDRIIELKERDKIPVRLTLQVDTQCYKSKGFIEKSARAGTRRVFIGLENINPDNLMEVNKRQNKIEHYRHMFLEWRKYKVVTYAGYITGFPSDTPESIVRDIEIIKRELPVDILEFFFLTPLPGSADHRELYLKQVAMDPDMNNYDLNHINTAHAVMSDEEWKRAYWLAWDTYYTPEHVETLMRRAAASGISPGKLLGHIVWFYGCLHFEGVHPLEGGLFRRKVRSDRRPGLPREPALTFYPKRAWQVVSTTAKFLSLALKYAKIRRAIKADPNAEDYTDTALTPVEDEGKEETFEMYDPKSQQVGS